MMDLYIVYVAVPLAAGFLLDCLLGDPRWLLHPVVIMGKLTAFLEKQLLRQGKHEFFTGAVLFFAVAGVSTAVPVMLLLFASWADRFIDNAFGIKYAITIMMSSLMCWRMLAAKSLKTESMKVYDALIRGDTEAARYAVSMIVGRDTSVLDRDGITRAAVETVAENTSDGVTAPIFFMALAGVPGLYLYKAVNTMDSMIGYKNEKYMFFGRFAAKMDDVFNFIPSRLTAMVMIFAAYLLPGFDARSACRIFRRDRLRHASPNSAQTESVCAGALRVRLAGPIVYFGVRHEKSYIGDDLRPIEAEDIKRANRLMYVSSVIMLLIMEALMAVLMRIW